MRSLALDSWHKGLVLVQEMDQGIITVAVGWFVSVIGSDYIIGSYKSIRGFDKILGKLALGNKVHACVIVG